MAKYDGLIIPRSYNDYINKSDPAGVAQALQLTGVMDAAPTAASTKPAKSGGIFAANAVIMASNKTLSGVAISAGSVVRVLFTAALTGSDATTGLTLTYNGNTYAVKVGKNGALANFLASNIDGSYIYCQAYTTLELMFDGTQFIIMGNPVVISSADYTIYTDGSKIGEIKTHTFTGTGTGAWAQMSGSITLEAGEWQISLYGKSTSTSSRLIQVPNLISTWFDMATTTNNTSYHEIVSLTVKLTSAKSIYINNFNSNGSAVTVYLNAVRIR